jgi:predicted metal-binding membrane protein
MHKVVMSQTAGPDFGHLPPAAAGLGHIFSRPKVLAGLCVVMLASLGWLYLAFVLVRMGGSLNGVGDRILPLMCLPLPDGSWTIGGVAIVASMWGAMTLAMMLPSAAPMIMIYAGIADTAAQKDERIESPFALAGGYMAVWFTFSVIAALAQIEFARAALIDASTISASGLFSGAIFITAGAYQFSKLKHACLTRCQQPFPFLFANWATTTRGVFRLGVKQGLYCLGCCWAMMMVMFAVGVMNIVWMVVLGAVMTIEKMLIGRRFTHMVGVLLIIAGIGIVFSAFVSHWPGRLS